MLPDPYCEPTRLHQMLFRIGVTLSIGLYLSSPPFPVRFRNGAVQWAAVPVAAIYIDRDSFPSKD